MNQIYNVTTDHGRNLIKTVDLLREHENEIENKTFLRLLGSEHFNLTSNETVRCPAYTLQLAVNDALRKDDEAQNVITQAKNICKILRELPNT